MLNKYVKSNWGSAKRKRLLKGSITTKKMETAFPDDALQRCVTVVSLDRLDKRVMVISLEWPEW